MTFTESQIMSVQDLANAYLSERCLEDELRQARQTRKLAEKKVSRNGALRLREPMTVRAGEPGTLVTATKTEADSMGDSFEFVVSTLAEVL